MATNPDTLAVNENALFINPSLGLFFGYVLLFGDDGEEALFLLAMFDGERSFLHDWLRKSRRFQNVVMPARHFLFTGCSVTGKYARVDR